MCVVCVCVYVCVVCVCGCECMQTCSEHVDSMYQFEITCREGEFHAQSEITITKWEAFNMKFLCHHNIPGQFPYTAVAARGVESGSRVDNVLPYLVQGVSYTQVGHPLSDLGHHVLCHGVLHDQT